MLGLSDRYTKKSAIGTTLEFEHGRLDTSAESPQVGIIASAIRCGLVRPLVETIPIFVRITNG
jgi:hypothetical protein